jgi:hypothetical protein
LRYVYYMDMKGFVNELDGVFFGYAGSVYKSRRDSTIANMRRQDAGGGFGQAGLSKHVFSVTVPAGRALCDEQLPSAGTATHDARDRDAKTAGMAGSTWRHTEFGRPSWSSRNVIIFCGVSEPCEPAISCRSRFALVKERPAAERWLSACISAGYAMPVMAAATSSGFDTMRSWLASRSTINFARGA